VVADMQTLPLQLRLLHTCRYFVISIVTSCEGIPASMLTYSTRDLHSIVHLGEWVTQYTVRQETG
jgi:hypothetical protein